MAYVGVLMFITLATGCAAATPTPVSQKTQTEAPAIKPSEASNQMSSYDCAVAEASITMVRTVFTEGKATPSQTAAILEGAAAQWDGVAPSYSGSKESWLRKMSELSLSLRGYILNGSPTNGDQLFDQLGNNFNLSTQFCG